MASSIDQRIAQLEILVSEQDYLIQTLNDVISTQDKSLARLEMSITRINEQFREFKSLLPDNESQGIEIPPHY